MRGAETRRPEAKHGRRTLVMERLREAADIHVTLRLLVSVGAGRSFQFLFPGTTNDDERNAGKESAHLIYLLFGQAIFPLTDVTKPPPRYIWFWGQ